MQLLTPSHALLALLHGISLAGEPNVLVPAQIQAHSTGLGLSI